MQVNATARNNCPICHAPVGETLLSLPFSNKMHLPDQVALKRCRDCDFAFTSPADKAAYTAYYSSIKTDVIHQDATVSHENGWVLAQLPAFATLLDTATPLRILDYGCGGGDLIKTLAARYKQHDFTGFDFHEIRDTTKLPNVHFSADFDALGAPFDLVIMSHVLEHFVDFDDLQPIIDRVKPEGQLYIEVPNPSTYAQSLQREFLFFIDRMHLSHFSAKSMLALGMRFGLQMQRYATLALPYRDHTTYPSHYFFFTKGNHSVMDDLLDYVNIEHVRPSPLADIPASVPLLVYGFGDNFFRCRSHGPLKDRPILAVMDQRAAELNQSNYRQDYQFMTMDEALAAHPTAPVIVTITWGAADVTQALQAKTRAPIYTV